METWLQDLMDALGVAKRQQLAEKLGMDPAMITYMERKGITWKGFDAMQRVATAARIELPDSVLKAYINRPARPTDGKDAA